MVNDNGSNDAARGEKGIERLANTNDVGLWVGGEHISHDGIRSDAKPIGEYDEWTLRFAGDALGLVASLDFSAVRIETPTADVSLRIDEALTDLVARSHGNVETEVILRVDDTQINDRRDERSKDLHRSDSDTEDVDGNDTDDGEDSE
jgi:hypothetical protein